LAIVATSLRSSLIDCCDVAFARRSFLLSFPLSPLGSRVASIVGVNPKAEALQRRTRAFLKRVIEFCENLKGSAAVRRITPQLLDSAGSTDSNYRAACRARSRKEFIAKLGVAAEEADESKGWLQALLEANLGNRADGVALIKEADELIAILVASQKTARKNAEKPPPDDQQ
jgi:four helix bundle protein